MIPYAQIAQTIFQQLGGNRFIAMTGARNFIAHQEGALSFRIPRSNRGINAVKITLTADDLYDVEYIRLHSAKTGKFHTVISEDRGIYWDDLETSFRLATGLVTHL